MPNPTKIFSIKNARGVSTPGNSYYNTDYIIDEREDERNNLLNNTNNFNNDIDEEKRPVLSSKKLKELRIAARNDYINRLNSDQPSISDFVFNQNQETEEKNQGMLRQLFNFAVQTGVGEIMLGTLKGFSDIGGAIYDKIAGGESDYTNPLSKSLEEAKENLKRDYEIVRKNPNKSFDISDSGWWFDNGVSVATTLSLLIPSRTIAGGLSKVGKATKSTDLGKNAIAAYNKYAKKALSQVSKNPSRTLSNLGIGTEMLGTAFLSRTAENYQEARETYKENYAPYLKEIENMDEIKRAEFIKRNPEYKDLSNEEIAHSIASKAADDTFKWDYWMLAFDVLQLRAIPSLWKSTNKASTAGMRIAERNVRRTLAAEAEGLTPVLEKNTLFNRFKESFKYGLTHPTKSILAAELSEGVEEGWQGAFQEYGRETGERIINPNYQRRSINSYLTDPKIWEQVFWGVMGGVVFQGGATALSNINRASKETQAKKDLESGKISQVEYDLRTLTDSKAREKSVEHKFDLIQTYVERINSLNENKDNTTHETDNAGNIVLDNEGKPAYRAIDEVEKDILKRKATSEFITNVITDAVDEGHADMAIDLLNSEEFKSYINKKLNNDDTSTYLSVEDIKNTANNAYEKYINYIDKVSFNVSTSNDYAIKMAARDLLTNDLYKKDAEDRLNDLRETLNEKDINGQVTPNLENGALLASISAKLSIIEDKYNENEENLKEGKINNSEYEYNKYKLNNEKHFYLDAYNKLNDNGIDFLKELNLPNIDEFVKKFSDFALNDNDLNTYLKSDLDKSLNSLLVDMSFQKLHIAAADFINPVTKSEYEEFYNNVEKQIKGFNTFYSATRKELVKNYIRENGEESILNNTAPDYIMDAIDVLTVSYPVVNPTQGIVLELKNEIERDNANNQKEKDEAIGKSPRRKEIVKEVEAKVNKPITPKQNNLTPKVEEETIEDEVEEDNNVNPQPKQFLPFTGNLSDFNNYSNLHINDSFANPFDNNKSATVLAETDDAISFKKEQNSTQVYTLSRDELNLFNSFDNKIGDTVKLKDEGEVIISNYDVGVDEENKNRIYVNTNKGIFKLSDFINKLDEDEIIDVQEENTPTNVYVRDKLPTNNRIISDISKFISDELKEKLLTANKENGDFDKLADEIYDYIEDTYIVPTDIDIIKQGMDNFINVNKVETNNATIEEKVKILDSYSLYDLIETNEDLYVNALRDIIKEYINEVNPKKINKRPILSLKNFVNWLNAKNNLNNLKLFVENINKLITNTDNFAILDNEYVLLGWNILPKILNNVDDYFSYKEEENFIERVLAPGYKRDTRDEIVKRIADGEDIYLDVMLNDYVTDEEGVPVYYKDENNIRKGFWVRPSDSRYDEFGKLSPVRRAQSILFTSGNVTLKGKDNDFTVVGRLNVPFAISNGKNTGFTVVPTSQSGLQWILSLDEEGNIISNLDDYFAELDEAYNVNEDEDAKEFVIALQKVKDLMELKRIKSIDNSYYKESMSAIFKSLMSKEEYDEEIGKDVFKANKFVKILFETRADESLKEGDAFYDVALYDFKLKNKNNKEMLYKKDGQIRFLTTMANVILYNDETVDTGDLVASFNSFKEKVYNNFKWTNETYEDILNAEYNGEKIKAKLSIEKSPVFNYDIKHRLLPIGRLLTDYNATDISLARRNPRTNEIIDDVTLKSLGKKIEKGDVDNAHIYLNIGKQEGEQVLIPIQNLNPISTEEHKDIVNALSKELKNTLLNYAKGKESYDVTVNKLKDLMGHHYKGKTSRGGLFSGIEVFEYQGTCNLSTTYVSEDGKTIKAVTLVTIYSNQDGKAVHNISFMPDVESGKKIISYKYSSATVRNIVNPTINNILNKLTFNIPFDMFVNKEDILGNSDPTPNKYIRKTENEGFEIKLGNKLFKYKNAADYIIKNNAFSTTMRTYENGKFVKIVYHDEVMSATTYKEKKLSPYLQEEMFSKENSRQLLEDLGLSEESIKVFMDGIEGMPGKLLPIISESYNVYKNVGRNAKFKGYYKKADNSINLNEKIFTGVKKVSDVKENANRKKNILATLIHENIHRLITENNWMNDNNTKELLECFAFAKKSIEEKYKENNLENYEQALNILNNLEERYNKKEITKNKLAEEFLIESFTNLGLSNILNSIEMKEANPNIPNKSIFQKILDFILDILYGGQANTFKIKNNSILANEYLAFMQKIDNIESNKSKTKKKTTSKKKVSKSKKETKENKEIEETIEKTEEKKDEVTDIDNIFDNEYQGDNIFNDETNDYDDIEDVEYSLYDSIEYDNEAEAYNNNTETAIVPIKEITDMDNYINEFPTEFKLEIASAVDKNEVPYMC